MIRTERLTAAPTHKEADDWFVCRARGRWGDRFSNHTTKRSPSAQMVQHFLEGKEENVFSNPNSRAKIKSIAILQQLNGEGWAEHQQKFVVRVPYICFFFSATVPATGEALTALPWPWLWPWPCPFFFLPMMLSYVSRATPASTKPIAQNWFVLRT